MTQASQAPLAADQSSASTTKSPATPSSNLASSPSEARDDAAKPNPEVSIAPLDDAKSEPKPTSAVEGVVAQAGQAPLAADAAGQSPASTTKSPAEATSASSMAPSSPGGASDDAAKPNLEASVAPLDDAKSEPQPASDADGRTQASQSSATTDAAGQSPASTTEPPSEATSASSMAPSSPGGASDEAAKPNPEAGVVSNGPVVPQPGESTLLTSDQSHRSFDKEVASLGPTEPTSRFEVPNPDGKMTAKVLLLQVAPGIHSLGDLDGKNIAIQTPDPYVAAIASYTFESLGLAPTLRSVDSPASPEHLLEDGYAATLVMMDADGAPKVLDEHTLRLPVDPWIVSLKRGSPH